MKIAMIGAGNVGGTLGRRWAANGHEVIFGVRDPKRSKIQNLLTTCGPHAHATSVTDAVSKAPLAVLTTPWHSAEAVIKSVHDWTGKILVDCTNPLKEDFSGLALGSNTSAGELVASWAVGARVVKAFNNTGSGNMANPVYGQDSVSMFICGDDSGARQIVTDLTSELEFDVVDCGGIEMARYLEPLAMLWVSLAYKQGLGADIGFRLMRR
ncbi:MAG: NADPH-dependent F420 reductase [bacterium]|nr:NADPH-dependent F420 reductase [bacterium]